MHPAAPVSALDFESAKPSVVKSIRQRDLLNNWLRLYASNQRLPRIEDYRPERLEDGGFEIEHLMRDTKLPQLKLGAVIDRELYHRTGRARSGEIIEFG